MIGSIASTFNVRVARWVVRSAISAISVPSTVVLVAVMSPRNKVFNATPHRCPPVRQASPKLRSLAMRSKTTVAANWPSSVRNALASALRMGKTMNRASRPAQPSTAAATNRSPRKKPRRAKPNAVSITSATRATAPPQPMPGCRAPISPNDCASISNAQPRAPIRKPLASSASRAAPAPTTSHAPWRRPGGSSAATAAAARPATPSASQGRPWASACSNPLAVRSPPRTWPIASRPLPSWTAYQGSSR